MKSKIIALSKNDEFKSLLKKKKISNRYVTIFFGHLDNKNNKKLNLSFFNRNLKSFQMQIFLMNKNF